MGTFSNFWQNIRLLFAAPQQEPKSPYADELIAFQNQRIAELKTEISQLKSLNSDLSKRNEDLRFKLEQVPRMNNKPSEAGSHEFDGELINDQPSFNEAGDQKQIEEFDKQASVTPAWLMQELTEIAAEQGIKADEITVQA